MRHGRRRTRSTIAWGTVTLVAASCLLSASSIASPGRPEGPMPTAEPLTRSPALAPTKPSESPQIQFGAMASAPVAASRTSFAHRDVAAAVGALFQLTDAGTLDNHFCTASVVDSPHGDLVLTAAHCVAGRDPATLAFVPAYFNGDVPYGIWRVTQVFVDSQWSSSASEDDDFAFLAVSGPVAGAAPSANAGVPSGQALEDLTGGEVLAATVRPTDQRVRVIGYPNASDVPISCVNGVKAFTSTQLEFDCDGYTGGTSGSPFIVAGPGGTMAVMGVIGGYQQGGDLPEVSYASEFGARLTALYKAAVGSGG
ncbi:MAG TPA: trypsin-like peptidase domain-containing protein [Acidimicrobiales bacterium]|nr:trypsin-like peptidase domain-containing protein [Acidimicrobiales bacterium]